jgi:hypothetical protein
MSRFIFYILRIFTQSTYVTDVSVYFVLLIVILIVTKGMNSKTSRKKKNGCDRYINRFKLTGSGLSPRPRAQPSLNLYLQVDFYVGENPRSIGENNTSSKLNSHMVSAELEPVTRTFGTTGVKDDALAAYATHSTLHVSLHTISITIPYIYFV